MHIFYVPDIPSDRVILNGEESGHAVRALRLKENDPVTLVDGKGKFCQGVILVPDPKNCVVSLQTIFHEYEKRNYFLHMAVAPTKNSERSDWLMEKTTEIGIDEFTSLSCKFSERRSINRERLERVAIAAMKQSQKAWLPCINGIITFNEFIQKPFDGDKFVAHCYPGEKPHLRDLLKPHTNSLIMIGPEGDFSREEVIAARQNGFKEVTLGTSRLRTETAAIVACHIASLANQ
jgi:16S rRNA (uracil1498-N3)-methyltransferase